MIESLSKRSSRGKYSARILIKGESNQMWKSHTSFSFLGYFHSSVRPVGECRISAPSIRPSDSSISNPSLTFMSNLLRTPPRSHINLDDDYEDSDFIQEEPLNPFVELLPPKVVKRVNTHLNEIGLPKLCLVENSDSAGHIAATNCLHRRSSEEMISRLEFHWGMAPGSMNLDTKHNVFYLSPDFRISFDISWFFFVPERRVLDLFPRKSREQFPLSNEKIYNYKLIAFEHLRDALLFRQHSEPPQDVSSLHDLESTSYTSERILSRGILHIYPFSALPPLKSHLQPQFVIADGGGKLLQLPNLRIIQKQLFALLSSALQLQLSTLKGAVSLLQYQVSLIVLAVANHQSDLSEESLFAVKEEFSTFSTDHSSTLTPEEFSALLIKQVAAFWGEKLKTLNALEGDLASLRTRLTRLEQHYPRMSEDLALLASIYVQWSEEPPLDCSFEGGECSKGGK